AARVGLQPVRDWRAFGLHGYPGFTFISNPFLRGSKPFWVTQCLKVYPQKPNVCNLDMHMSPSDTEDIWDKSVLTKTLLEKLRWVTLGYHYNWDTKTYSANHYTPFPADLHSLAFHVASACGSPGFNAQAGILNYYGCDSSLGIHVDESELAHSRPLLSFSRRQDPRPLCTSLWDVMVMSGPSRLFYHAVPRIVAPPQGRPVFEAESCSPASSERDWAACCRYMQGSRVNVTVRQVLGPGQRAPPRGTRFSRDIGTGTGICNDIVLQNEVFYVTTEE
uniref:Alpha-ketoglutarate-dependent dioxygenase AlkB-like domain-containing protein n=1 Tax=Gasterosteus aculeatus aculeatus TaxID=481459 RepID=A0AAQ4QAF8_GASAC